MADNLNPGVPLVIDQSLVSYTHIIYALHAFAVLIGIGTAHTIVGSFVCGVPSIIAVIMNYARRSATRGTYLESHFTWQIRTFWGAAFCALAIYAVTLPLMLVLIGFPLFFAAFAVLTLWIIYRVARGWLALRDRKPMYL